uniref:Uncharacterized protein n=1 Tax=Meloidogyne enterolobii TaxID=390850 RepID=A0A6V7TRI7_MELEN|nr:unnamed protein product [Meloidogyne enterolobii]
MNFSSNKPPASVDAVIEQIQILAGDIHQLGKEVGSRVQKVGLRGEQTVTHFDSSFGEIGNNVDKIIGTLEVFLDFYYFWVFCGFWFFYWKKYFLKKEGLLMTKEIVNLDLFRKFFIYF